MKKAVTKFYECGICGHIHPWDWDGDCRDDAFRFDEVPADAEVVDPWADDPWADTAEVKP